ncbi:MAG: SDR family oxidoreductase [Gammaproteobacteria bacterium]|nr:SDR family oxidoreductase [Gammaproteobacteria bacterium]
MPTVLVTGANRGLGLEFTRQYCDAGWQVIATCRDPAGAAELQALRSQHPGLEIEALDVGDFATIDALAARLAGRPMDVLLNNAGVFGPKPGAEQDLRQNFGSMDYEVWTEVLRVNLMAPMKMAEAFVDHVAASAQKKIVAISSTEGSSPNAKGGIYAYRTSKAALNMLMQNLAPDLAPRGIVTAAFCPGWIRTRIGGPRAPLEAPPSIAGLRRVIDGLTPENSGKFWLWTGERLPW